MGIGPVARNFDITTERREIHQVMEVDL
jgi:hypothetical protein